MSIGYQITQTAHAIADLAVAHPQAFSQWHDVSNSIIVLQTPNAEALYELYVQARNASMTIKAFREPDYGDEITAIAFLPSEDNPRFLGSLPLAGKQTPTEDIKRAESALKRASFSLQGQKEFKQGQLLRECYFAFLDHLHGRIDLSQYPSWAHLPSFSTEERLSMLESQPHPWTMDRSLTFFFASAKQRQPYAHDERIVDIFTSPEQIPGFNLIQTAYNNLKENL